MRQKLLSHIKEYPYFSLLLITGICVYLSCGAHYAGQRMERENASRRRAVTNAAGLSFASIGEEVFSSQETKVPSEAEDTIVGVTDFLYYDPKPVNSLYYEDPGKIALTTEYPYETVDETYFSDAAFIGDSRTLGLYDYSGLPEADFYCDNGFCTYRWENGTTIMHQNTGREVLLDEAISMKKYTKLYVMVGLNDCGYGNIDHFRERYRRMLDMLRGAQPNAVIYLLANLHISKEKSDADPVYNNDDINAHNVAIAELADGVTFFYLDAGSLFLDEERDLRPELTFDGVHLYADGYRQWTQYLKEHAVVRP